MSGLLLDPDEPDPVAFDNEPVGQAIWAERLARLLPAAYDAFLRR